MLLPIWLVMGIALAVADRYMGPFINFPVFFLLPVALAAWFNGRLPGVAMAVLLPMVRPFYFMEIWSGGELTPTIVVVNMVIKILVFTLLAELLHRVAAASRFRSQILESLPVGVRVEDRSGQVLASNRVADSIWGQVRKGGNEHDSDGSIEIYAHGTDRRLGSEDSPQARAVKQGRTNLNELLDLRKSDGISLTIMRSVKPLRNEMERVIGSLTVSQDITQVKQLEKERADLVVSLEAAAMNIRILKGLLPVCACCKKIRDNRGDWQQMEEYIRTHSEAEFSHGICPECMKSVYPDYS